MLGKRRREAEDYPGTADDRTTWHRWAGWDEISEHGAGASYWEVGAPRTTHLPGLAVLEGAAPATAEARHVLGDHLGSVRQLVGQTKAPLARYDYAPYGELSRSAGLPLTVGYTGHRWDQAVGQYFAPFRYYNPKTARWNMRDPLGFVDGPNVYAYVAGNPVNRMDPTGLIIAVAPYLLACGYGAAGAALFTLAERVATGDDCPIDWGDVGRDALAGCAGGVLTLGVGNIAARLQVSYLRQKKLRKLRHQAKKRGEMGKNQKIRQKLNIKIIKIKTEVFGRMGLAKLLVEVLCKDSSEV